MPDNPSIYLDTPDPLSVLLTRLNLNATIYVSGDFCGTWAVDTAGSRRIPFHLIGSGAAWLHLDGKAPEHLAAHDLVIFPHDAHHIISNSKVKPVQEKVNQSMSNDGDVTQMICGFFEFRSPVLFPVLDSLPQTVVLHSSKGETGRRIEALISLMLAELDNAHPGFYTAINQVAFLLFVEVLRRQMDSGVITGGLLSALFDERLGKALNAIHQGPETAWTLESLAGEALMSRSSFADRFRQVVGLTPMKYLTQWRMNEARHLLLTTGLSVAQIAEKSGYETEAAFRKAYKNTLGETPGVVRAKK